MGMPGTPELLIIAVIAIVLFGTKKVKNMGSDFGGFLTGLRKGLKEDDDDE